MRLQKALFTQSILALIKKKIKKGGQVIAVYHVTESRLKQGFVTGILF